MAPHVVLLNGSIRGREGNTGWLLEETVRRLGDRATTQIVDLADPQPEVDELVVLLRKADAFVVGTGVYWHSWGSPLQRFLEVLTPFENSEVFFEKPVAGLITMDSVGGAELCARLLSVFGQFGCELPPCTSLVLGRVALESTDDDVWGLEDLDVVADNLLTAATGPRRRFRPWIFRPLMAPRGAWPAAGRLDLGSPRFLPPK